MKLLIVLLMTALLHAPFKGISQRINFKGKDVPLEKIFSEIKKQTGYGVLYVGKTLEGTTRVSINAQNMPLTEFLNRTFKDQPLIYKMESKTISIFRKGEERRVEGPPVKVSGVVVNEKGDPLPNASVRMKGENEMTSTNDKGMFIMRGREDGVLVVSYVGYKQLEIPLKDEVMPLEIKLAQIAGELEEVKLTYNTGYQELDLKRATGSVVHIDNKLLNRRATGSVLDRILDVTSGLIGQPALRGVREDAGGITIRGISTINSRQHPLIVVDNFIYDGDLRTINPNDIEYITILKDAVASSIWGARSANGVIVITTKKGRLNQPVRVGFNSNITIGQTPDLNYIKSISSAEIIEFEKQQFSLGVYDVYDDVYPSSNYFPVLSPGVEVMLAARRGDISWDEANAKLEAYKNHDVRDDINKYMLQKSLNQQYSLNVAGGGNNYTYYTSIGYDKARTVNVGNSDSRLSLNFNNTFRPVKRLEIRGFMVYTQTKSQDNALNHTNFLPIGHSTSPAPYTMLADASGKPLAIPYRSGGYRTAYADTATYPGLLDWHYRPLDETKYQNLTTEVIDLRTGADVKYIIWKGLSAEAKYQYQQALGNTRSYYSQNSYINRNEVNTFAGIDPVTNNIVYPYPLGDYMNLRNSRQVSWSLRGQIGFDRRWSVHELNILAGSEIRQATTETRDNSLYGIDPNVNTSVFIDQVNLYPTRFGGSGRVGNLNTFSGLLDRFGSYFGNLGYTLLNKYTLNTSARIDQSNFFGVKANQRRTPFWSVGIAWELSKEKFYKASWLPYLKVRSTYGYNGNTNGGTAYATAQYSTSTIADPGVQYATILTGNNPGLRWERTRMINFAADFISKNNRIGGTIEYYTKRSLDLVGPVISDPTTGFSSYTGNSASIKGRGIDITLNTINTMGNVKWNSTFLLSYNTDEVTSYTSTSKAVFNTDSRAPVVGQPLNKISSYRFAGLDPANGAPLIYVNGKIANNNDYQNVLSGDLVYSGPASPLLFGSFLNTINWRSFSLSVGITYRMNYYFRRSTINYSSLYNNWGGHADYLFRWQKPGDEIRTYIPSLPPYAEFDKRDQVFPLTDELVEKGDYIRLQDIRLSYNFNNSSQKKLPFQNLQVYMYINNPGIIWTKNGYDIDPLYSGENSIPEPLSFTIGVAVSF